MDKFNRSVRRHHITRLKKIRSKYYWSWDYKNPKQVGKLVHTPALCSCHMCGNPRKHFRQRSFSELIDDFKFNYELLEYYSEQSI